MSYFPKAYTDSKNKIEVEIDVSNYETKSDLKNATGVDTSVFAKKVDLVNLKSEVDKLNIDKLKNVSSALSSLESKVEKLDICELKITPIDLNRLVT